MNSASYNTRFDIKPGNPEYENLNLSIIELGNIVHLHLIDLLSCLKLRGGDTKYLYLWIINFSRYPEAEKISENTRIRVAFLYFPLKNFFSKGEYQRDKTIIRLDLYLR